MKTKHLLAAGLLAAVLTPLTGRAAAFVPGEILVTNFDPSSNIRRYGEDGTLLQTWTTDPHYLWLGAGLTPDGNVVTTFRTFSDEGGVNIFSPAGRLLKTFTATFNYVPGDVSV